MTNHKFKPVPETIHHKPTIVSVPNTPDPYPYSKRWPPDPDIYAPPFSFAIQEGKTDCCQEDQRKEGEG